jgi:hypothetical protein
MKPLVLIAFIIAVTAGCLTNNSNNKDIVVKGVDTLPKDSVVGHYIPLPCATGIDLEKLYGSWRTIGDEYNDATFKYWINTIDTSGNWIIDKVDSGKIAHRYSGKIKSMNKKDHTIDVESKDGITILEIMNLTETCFEYRLKANKDKIWRMDRMK